MMGPIQPYRKVLPGAKPDGTAEVAMCRNCKKWNLGLMPDGTRPGISDPTLYRECQRQRLDKHVKFERFDSWCQQWERRPHGHE